MKNAIHRPDPPPARPDLPAGMLDDPGHLRQWLARRLQRAIILERWGEGLRRGLARLGPPRGPVLVQGADAAGRRLRQLRELLQDLEVPPYRSLGLAAPVGRFGGALLALLSGRAARAAAGWLVEHTLSEYTVLAALVEDSAGRAPVDLETVRELIESAAREARTWKRLSSGHGAS